MIVVYVYICIKYAYKKLVCIVFLHLVAKMSKKCFCGGKENILKTDKK